MDALAAVDFGFARVVVQHGIAALFLIAFWSSLNQFPALAGQHGLLPAPRLLAWARASSTRTPAHPRSLGRLRGVPPRRRSPLRPTLFFWVGYTDRRLRILCVAGMTVAATLLTGLPQRGPAWLPMLCFLALWLAYMSITSIGQTFYAFGWEMLLLEAGFLAAFLGSDDQPPATVVIVLIWWLVFRLEFGAGMIKIRGGREWRDLTALMYHHQTQPMPGPFSRQAHLLPAWFHRGEVIGNHFAQLVVPWFLFAPLLGIWVPGPWPAVVGAAAASVIIATQVWLVLTGNFAWLNWATIVLAFAGIGLPPQALPAPLASAPLTSSTPLQESLAIGPAWLVVTGAVGLLYIVISRWPVRNLFARRQLMNASFTRWQLANAYGAFGTVTRQRIEYVIECTAEEDPDAAQWAEYVFRGKPGPLRRVPGQVAPYHLRLDWLMWFLPLGQPIDGWFSTLLVRLLESDPATLRLLAHCPLGTARPRWVRVVAYRYRFATRAQRRVDGAVWVRDRRRVIVRPISAREVAG